MRVQVSPEALRRFRDTLRIYRTYMTKREAAKRSDQVKVGLRSLRKGAQHGAFEDLLEIPADGIRYGRIVAGHFKIVYRIVGSVVQVSDIFDSRQAPQHMSR